jgi:hypothetical protein
MTRSRWLPLSLLLVSTACFHQVVNTGRAPGSTVVDKPFVATWLWGIVPGPPIDVRRDCPTGVAIVETETSFMNGLVGALTLGIFTPQHARITCASGTASLPRGAVEVRIPAEATADQSAEIVNRAVARSMESHTPTVLRF